MPSIDFQVYCATCGGGLCNLTTVNNGSRGVTIEIETCPRCLESAKADSYNEGYDKAQEEQEAV